jgi:hypothetical protein
MRPCVFGACRYSSQGSRCLVAHLPHLTPCSRGKIGAEEERSGDERARAQSTRREELGEE